MYTNIILLALFGLLLGSSFAFGPNPYTNELALFGLILYVGVQEVLRYSRAHSKDPYNNEWVKGVKDGELTAILPPDGRETKLLRERVVERQAQLGDLVDYYIKLHNAPYSSTADEIKKAKIREALNLIQLSWISPLDAIGESPRT